MSETAIGGAHEAAPPSRVLIVDDDAGFSELLRALVSSDRRFEVVGQARDGTEALALAFTLRPQIILMDIDMPVLDGLEATAAILLVDPSARVIVVSGIDDHQLVSSARLAGAIDWVEKGRVHEELIDAMLAAHSYHPRRAAGHRRSAPPPADARSPHGHGAAGGA